MINELVKDNAPVQNEEARDLLKVCCLKRVNLNYEKENFEGNMIVSYYENN
jgi:hypothetical protein